MTHRRRRRAQIGGFLEHRRGAPAVPREMSRRAAEEQANRAPRAVRRRELERACGGLLHPADSIAADDRLEAGEPCRQRAGAAGIRAAPHCGCRRRGEVACLGGVPGRDEAVGGRERERRVARELIATEAGQPSLDDFVASLGEVPDDAWPKEISGPHGIVGVHCMRDRPIDIPVRLVPQARALVERAHELGSRPPQLRAERVAEQPMPPEVLVSGIERTQQRGGPLQARQDAPRTSALEHRVADRTGQLVDDRRPDGKIGEVRRQRRQHLVAEILGEGMVVASEPAERAADVDLVAQRQGREI